MAAAGAAPAWVSGGGASPAAATLGTEREDGESRFSFFSAQGRGERGDIFVESDVARCYPREGFGGHVDQLVFLG